MDIWKTIITEGNRLFAQSDFENAEQKYLEALNRARFLFTHWSAPDRAVSSLVVSYQNLSDNYIKLNQLKSAGFYLIDAHKCLCQLMIQYPAPSAWHAACLLGQKHIASSIQELLKTSPELPICKDCYNQIFQDLNVQSAPAHIH